MSDIFNAKGMELWSTFSSLQYLISQGKKFITYVINSIFESPCHYHSKKKRLTNKWLGSMREFIIFTSFTIKTKFIHFNHAKSNFENCVTLINSQFSKFDLATDDTMWSFRRNRVGITLYIMVCLIYRTTSCMGWLIHSDGYRHLLGQNVYSS